MRGILRGSFACYDLCVANGGTLVYTALNLLLMLILAVWQIVRGETAAALFGIGSTIVSILVSFLLLGAYIMITERKRIALTRRQRILYTLTFPLFMTTWIPVSIAALLPGKAEWHPIRHKGTIPSVTK